MLLKCLLNKTFQVTQFRDKLIVGVFCEAEKLCLSNKKDPCFYLYPHHLTLKSIELRYSSR